MAYEVTTHPEALEELDQALEWLAKGSNWTPVRLLSEYDSHVAQIKQRPESFRFAHQGYRRLNLHRFPYAIIYRLRASDIYIIAVMHQKRHPDYWKHRIEDDIA